VETNKETKAALLKVNGQKQMFLTKASSSSSRPRNDLWW